MKAGVCKRLAALLLCVLCVVSLVGCGDNSSPVGTWELTAAAINGESIDSEIGFVNMTLQADGTAKLVTNGTSADSTWSYENGTLIIDGQTYAFENGVITFNYDSMYMKFTKK